MTDGYTPSLDFGAMLPERAVTLNRNFIKIMSQSEQIR